MLKGSRERRCRRIDRDVRATSATSTLFVEAKTGGKQEVGTQHVISKLEGVTKCKAFHDSDDVSVSGFLLACRYSSSPALSRSHWATSPKIVIITNL